MPMTGWAAEEAVPITVGEAASTYSVGGAGAKATRASLAFRFRCVRPPRFGETSPFVLLLAAFSPCSAPRALLGSDAGGRERTAASPPAFSVPASSLLAFLSGRVIWGCFLESR